MNQRQKLKKLKNDNEIMKQIINNTPEMKRLYTAYNEPMRHISFTTMQYRQYRIKRSLTREDEIYPTNEIIDQYKRRLTEELASKILKDTRFEVEYGGLYPTIEATVFVGVRRD